MRSTSGRLRYCVALLSAGGVILGLFAAVPGGLSPDPAERLSLSIPTEHGRPDEPRLVAVSPHRVALRRVAAIFDELQLPLPRQISLHLYASRADLSRGLLDHRRLSPAVATGVGEFAAGVSFQRTLLLLESETRRGTRAWLRLLAHEMTHLAQIELANGEGRGARWISEGMADWVAFTVLDRLGIASFEGERPVLADDLIEQHGFDRLLAYFGSFATPHVRDHFENAFGRSMAAFEREVRLGQALTARREAAS